MAKRRFSAISSDVHRAPAAENNKFVENEHSIKSPYSLYDLRFVAEIGMLSCLIKLFRFVVADCPIF